MKASFCTNAFGNTQQDIQQAIPKLAQMGYDGLEFWEQYLPGADLKWLKGIMDAHHLEIVQICPYFDFTTSSETWEAEYPGCRAIYRVFDSVGRSLYPYVHRQCRQCRCHNGAVGCLRERAAADL